MELNFEQVNGAYVARVTVDGAYAVHLERSGRCPLAVLQRHGEQGQYVPCPLPSVTGTLAPAVVDVSLDHCVYPVEVEIVSGLLPQVATLTRYAGGGGGGGIPEAPADGKTYGRKDAAWAEVADAAAVADLSAAQEQQGQKLAALEEADTAQDTKIEALEGGLADVEGKVEAMPAAYTLDSSLFHITDESTSEQIRDALEASGGFEAIVEALKRGDALYLHYSGEGWDGTYTESGINLVYGYVTEDDNGTTNLCLYFTRKNNIDVYDIYHDPDDDTYSARNFDYDLSVLDSDEYPLSTLGQKYQQLEASQARQDEKIEALETAQTEQGQRLTAAEGDIAALEGRMDTAEGEIDALQTADTAQDEKITALETADAQQDEKITALETADTQQDGKIEALETASAGHDEAIGELETKVEGLEAGGGFPEAPADGKTYGRRDKAWAPVPDPSADIAALEGRMDTAEGEIDDLQAADAAQDEKITALETAQTEQGQRLTAAEGDIAALEGRMDTAEGEIDDLQAADAQQDEKITALETADAQQDTKIEALETASAGHDEAIGELETKVEGLEAGGGFPEAPADGKTYGRRDKAWAPVPDPSADIAALEGRMDTAEGEIDALQAADTEQDGRLDALEASDTAQDGKITALEAADTALGERVSEAEGKITTAEGKITTAEGDIDALEGRVAELEEQGGGGLSDAPQDGTLYGRRDGAWVPGMDYPSDDSFPRENEVYGRGRNGWIQVQMAVNTITYEEVGSDFADIGFVGTYNFHSSYTDWTPMVFYGISAYGLQSPTEQQKLRRMFSYMIVMTKAKYYILMGGCTEATAELPVAYAVSNSGGEITITGVDVNAFPEAYRFHMVINSSGTITENTITQIQG